MEIKKEYKKNFFIYIIGKKKKFIKNVELIITFFLRVTIEAVGLQGIGKNFHQVLLKKLLTYFESSDNICIVWKRKKL